MMRGGAGEARELGELINKSINDWCNKTIIVVQLQIFLRTESM